MQSRCGLESVVSPALLSYGSIILRKILVSQFTGFLTRSHDSAATGLAVRQTGHETHLLRQKQLAVQVGGKLVHVYLWLVARLVRAVLRQFGVARRFHFGSPQLVSRLSDRRLAARPALGSFVHRATVGGFMQIADRSDGRFERMAEKRWRLFGAHWPVGELVDWSPHFA